MKKIEHDIVREKAEQVLMDKNYWIHERFFQYGKFFTRIETPGGFERNVTDEQLINMVR